ncbi:hypothetical protein B0H13DRAFT_1871101 [Mycena leptocephala]|nr:hypothetical protein B0H13DRAFT_1871101 [Mycena leptocephala]
MNLDNFTFTFQLPSFPQSPTPASQPALAASSSLTPSSSTTSSHAEAQARYWAKQRKGKGSTAYAQTTNPLRRSETSTSPDWNTFRSEELRATKTFAAFREYVREFMFWVQVDNNDPQAVAAYNQFIKNNTPNPGHDLSDNDLEFLFRHVTPAPETSPSSPMSSLNHDEATDCDNELTKLELKRRRARERMARHRLLLLHKERVRRQQKSPFTIDEYIRLRRIRESRPSFRNYQRTSTHDLQMQSAPPPLFPICNNFSFDGSI